MKKLLLPILLFVMFMPFMVNAKEYCKVVDGDGKSIGSEIACGTEHFYIIESNEEEIKMLAKYNLYTGVTIYKEKMEKEEGDTRTDYQYCNDLAVSKGGTVRTDGIHSQIGYCYYMIPIEEDVILQNENAIGAHVDENGNYLYPQVGDVYMKDYYGSYYYPEEIEKTIQGTNFSDYHIDISSYNDSSSLFINNNLSEKPQGVNGPLYFYKRELEKMDYTIEDISMLSLSELNQIIETISGKSLPFQTWNSDVQITFDSGTSSNYGYLAEFGSLKEYVPKEYSWLYSTTYWNRSIYSSSTTFSGRYYVFTAQQGKICGAGFEMCVPTTEIGCGIRPVVTIKANELMYLIKTETDGNGEIEVVDNSIGGETINFKITAKEGYKLNKLVITTDSGETVEFSEGEIIKNDDGTFSIDNNKFTMPFENVTIQAKWVSDSIINVPDTLKNLMTIDKVFIIFLLMILIIGIIKKNNLYKKRI